MKSLFLLIGSRLLPLLAAVFMLGQFWLSLANAQTADRIVGSWVRVGDELRGYVIEIYRLDDGRYEARTLHAPFWASIDGFQIGERILRSIATRGDGTYVAEGLRRGEDGLQYSVGELSVIDSERLVYICKNNSEGVEERQKWRRIQSSDTLYAYVEFGRGLLAAEEKNFDEASRALERAAAIIMKDDSPLSIRNLANDVAWTLATDSRREIRNPALARTLLPALGDWYASLDTAAVVYAANGEFENASILQDKALRGARRSDAVEVFMEKHQADKDILGKQIFAEATVRRWLSEMEGRKRLYEKRLPFVE